MAKSALIELRDTLAAVVRELGEEGHSSREIAEEFQRRHPDLIRQSTPELVASALVQEVGAVSKRKGRASLVPSQTDLFEEFKFRQTLTVPSDAGRKSGKIRKNPNKLTEEELDSCIEYNSLQRQKNLLLVSELKRLRNKIKPFMKPGMLVEDGLAMARAHEEEKIAAEKAS